MEIKFELEIKKSPVMSVVIDKITYDENKIIIDRNRVTIKNNTEGRKTLQANYSKEIVDEVMAVWGDKPTEEDFVLPDLPKPIPQTVSLEQRIADIEDTLATAFYGSAANESSIL